MLSFGELASDDSDEMARLIMLCAFFVFVGRFDNDEVDGETSEDTRLVILV